MERGGLRYGTIFLTLWNEVLYATDRYSLRDATTELTRPNDIPYATERGMYFFRILRDGTTTQSVGFIVL